MRIDTAVQIRQLEKINRMAEIGYWIYTHNSNEMWWSNITYELLGYTDKDFTPTRKHLLRHIHPEDLVFFQESLKQIQSQTIEIEFRFYKNGELRLGKITGKIYTSNDDEVTEEILFQDITKIKIKEFEIAKAWNKALEAENLKNSFLSNMSHELRTPLNSIIGFSELLETETVTESTHKFATSIKKSGLQLLKIIEDLLKVSMLESRTTKPVKRKFHVNEMLNDIEEICCVILKNLKKEHLSLHFTFGLKKEMDAIVSDQIKIRDILRNLLHNAIKFTEKGSITCSYKIVNHSIHFSVSDTGIGIPEKYKDRVFQRFSQANESNERYYGGTGLGLYISRLEIELLGGKIWFLSQEHNGTTVNFTIPNVIKAKHLPDNSKAVTCNWENYTVVIAEDQATNYKMLEAYLQATNINIIWAKNGQEVIQACLQKPEINIVLMDINIPLIDGLEATKQIKEKRPNLTIIAQTAYAFKKDREKSINAGCSDYLSKPIKKSDLLESMAKFLP